ncbi:MAG: hypothetical protein Q8O84_02365 [Nanoarchaeota archaeon]|nr:hypothetical protein [Nanoarchaeota archaeon]
MEYFPVSSVNPDIEVTKATISNTNEIINKATIAEEFPIRAGRTKKNKDNKSIIKENVEAIFFAMIK